MHGKDSLIDVCVKVTWLDYLLSRSLINYTNSCTSRTHLSQNFVSFRQDSKKGCNVVFPITLLSISDYMSQIFA